MRFVHTILQQVNHEWYREFLKLVQRVVVWVEEHWIPITIALVLLMIVAYVAFSTMLKMVSE